jgi:Na+/melibiose symporter-like transporter
MRWVYLAVLGVIASVGLMFWGLVWLIQNNKYGALLTSMGIIGMIMIPFCYVVAKERKDTI